MVGKRTVDPWRLMFAHHGADGEPKVMREP